MQVWQKETLDAGRTSNQSEEESPLEEMMLVLNFEGRRNEEALARGRGKAISHKRGRNFYSFLLENITEICSLLSILTATALFQTLSIFS